MQDATLRAVAASEFNCHGFDLFGLLGCDRDCDHCILWTSDLKNFMNFMSVSLVKNVIWWATAPGSPFTEATLLGGEFPLHLNASEIIKLLAAARCANGEHMRVRMVTNGSNRFRRLLRDPEIVDILRLGCVNVSLEHFEPEINDRIRGRHAHRNAVDAMAQLRRLGIPFAVNITVSRINRDGLAGTLAFAESAGAGRGNVHWFTPGGNGSARMAHEQITQLKWIDVIRAATAYPAGPGFVVDVQQGYLYDEVPNEDPGACAIRSRTNLQFYPPTKPGSLECRASSCGMFSEYHESGGYWFGPGGMREIIAYPQGHGTPENAIVGEDCGRCPVSDFFAGRGDKMVCIYRRVPRGLQLPTPPVIGQRN